jgi:hypothetical protein
MCQKKKAETVVGVTQAETVVAISTMYVVAQEATDEFNNVA